MPIDCRTAIDTAPGRFGQSESPWSMIAMTTSSSIG